VIRIARTIALMTITAAPLALAGCAGAPKPTLYCPEVAVLQQANHIVRLNGDTDELAARIVDARITGVAGTCAKTGKSEVTVAFRIGFTATRGPAATGDTATLPYFIATTDGNRIIDKEVYSVTFHFKGGAEQAVATTKRIRIEAPNVQRSADQEVLVGFQLDRAELAHELGETR